MAPKRTPKPAPPAEPKKKPKNVPQKRGRGNDDSGYDTPAEDEIAENRAFKFVTHLPPNTPLPEGVEVVGMNEEEEEDTAALVAGRQFRPPATLPTELWSLVLLFVPARQHYFLQSVSFSFQQVVNAVLPVLERKWPKFLGRLTCYMRVPKTLSKFGEWQLESFLDHFRPDPDADPTGDTSDEDVELDRVRRPTIAATMSAAVASGRSTTATEQKKRTIEPTRLPQALFSAYWLCRRGFVHLEKLHVIPGSTRVDIYLLEKCDKVALMPRGGYLHVGRLLQRLWEFSSNKYLVTLSEQMITTSLQATSYEAGQCKRTSSGPAGEESIAEPAPQAATAGFQHLYQLAERHRRIKQTVEIPALRTPLAPYQIQAVLWMQRQETRKSLLEYFPFFCDSCVLWVCPRTGQITTNYNKSTRHGGWLATDMGLGKTVMLLGLVLASGSGRVDNPREDMPDQIPANYLKERRTAYLEPGMEVNVLVPVGLFSSMLQPAYVLESSADKVHVWFPSNERDQWVTREAIKADSYLEPCPTYVQGGTLVITAVSLLGQWKSEIASKVTTGALKVLVWNDKREQDLEKLAEYDIVLTTYSLMAVKQSRQKGAAQDGDQPAAKRRIIGDEDDAPHPLLFVRWNRLIVDEGHTLRNTDSATARNILKISARSRWLVTGTPISNDPVELDGQLRFLRGFGEPKRFFTSAQSITELLGQHMIRHRRNIISLPDRKVSNVILEFPAELRSIYERVHAEYGRVIHAILNDTKGRIVGALSLGQPLVARLRQLCAHPPLAVGTDLFAELLKALDLITDLTDVPEELQLPKSVRERFAKIQKDFEHVITKKAGINVKIQAVLKELEEMKEGSKAIVFSEYPLLLEDLNKALGSKGIRTLMLKGGMSHQQRSRTLKQLEDGDARVLLLTFRSGACGMTLVCADHVFLMEQCLNPALEDQAYGRCHRIGQTKAVRMKKFVMQDSIEHQLMQLQQKDYLVSEAATTLSAAKQQLQKSQLRFLLEDIRIGRWQRENERQRRRGTIPTFTRLRPCCSAMRRILGFLDEGHLLRFAQLSRSCLSLFEFCDDLWKPAFYRRFGYLPQPGPSTIHHPRVATPHFGGHWFKKYVERAAVDSIPKPLAVPGQPSKSSKWHRMTERQRADATDAWTSAKQTFDQERAMLTKVREAVVLEREIFWRERVAKGQKLVSFWQDEHSLDVAHREITVESIASETQVAFTALDSSEESPNEFADEEDNHISAFCLALRTEKYLERHVDLCSLVSPNCKAVQRKPVAYRTKVYLPGRFTTTPGPIYEGCGSTNTRIPPESANSNEKDRTKTSSVTAGQDPAATDLIDGSTSSESSEDAPSSKRQRVTSVPDHLKAGGKFFECPACGDNILKSQQQHHFKTCMTQPTESSDSD